MCQSILMSEQLQTWWMIYWRHRSYMYLKPKYARPCEKHIATKTWIFLSFFSPSMETSMGTFRCWVEFENSLKLIIVFEYGNPSEWRTEKKTNNNACSVDTALSSIKNLNAIDTVWGKKFSVCGNGLTTNSCDWNSTEVKIEYST